MSACASLIYVFWSVFCWLWRLSARLFWVIIDFFSVSQSERTMPDSKHVRVHCSQHGHTAINLHLLYKLSLPLTLCLFIRSFTNTHSYDYTAGITHLNCMILHHSWIDFILKQNILYSMFSSSNTHTVRVCRFPASTHSVFPFSQTYTRVPTTRPTLTLIVTCLNLILTKT